MKLRIRGNSLRFRLTRTEVQRLGAGAGPIEDCVRFGPESALVYSVEGAEVTSPRATLTSTPTGTRVRLIVPQPQLTAWAHSDQVGFEAEQSTGDGHSLRILVEKDWNCLTSRPGEEDVDTFPNPNTSC